MSSASESQDGATATDPGRAAHFDETVKKSLGDVKPTYWGGILLMVGILGVLLWIGLTDGPILLAGVGAAGIAFLPVVLYTTFGQGIRVLVTDEGVEVHPIGYRFGDSEGISVRFDEITEVEYNEPDGPFIYVQDRDKPGAEAFMVEYTFVPDEDSGGSNFARNKFWTGVRIARADDSTVYVGSGRPAELAGLIADRAPGVTGTGVLSLSEYAY